MITTISAVIFFSGCDRSGNSIGVKGVPKKYRRLINNRIKNLGLIFKIYFGSNKA